MLAPLTLLIIMTAGAFAAPMAIDEAQGRVQAAADAVAACARPKSVEAERLGYELIRLGHAVLGRGYNVAEASEILARMVAWLASPEGRKIGARLSGEEGTRRLLELAARQAHPEIAAGRGSRNAVNWSDFVVGAAFLTSEQAELAEAHEKANGPQKTLFARR